MVTTPAELHEPPSADDVAKFAHRAVLETVQANPPTDAVIARSTVLRWGGFPSPPDVLTSGAHVRWGLAQLQFFKQWRAEVLTRCGRDPLTVPGHGFRLCGKGEVLPEEERKFWRRMAKGFQAFDFKAAAVNRAALDADERQAATDSEARMGLMKTLVKRANTRDEQSQNWREE